MHGLIPEEELRKKTNSLSEETGNEVSYHSADLMKPQEIRCVPADWWLGWRSSSDPRAAESDRGPRGRGSLFGSAHVVVVADGLFL